MSKISVLTALITLIKCRQKVKGGVTLTLITIFGFLGFFFHFVMI